MRCALFRNMPISHFQNSSLKQKVQDLEARKEESTSEVLHFRHTLENTVSLETGHSVNLVLCVPAFLVPDEYSGRASDQSGDEQ